MEKRCEITLCTNNVFLLWGGGSMLVSVGLHPKKNKTPFKQRNAQNASRKSLTVKLHSKNQSHCCTGIEVGLIRHLVASRGAWLRETIEDNDINDMCSIFEGCIIGSTYMQS